MSTQTYDPIPNPAPPTFLTWQGSAAPPIWPSRLPGMRSSTTWVSPVVLPNMSWHPTRPRTIWPIKTLHGRSVLAAGAGVLQVPFLGWKTISRRTQPSRPLLRPRVSTVIAPETILTAAPCVEWVDTAYTHPTSDSEGIGRPSMLTGVEGDNFLLLEDGGFFLLESGGQILLESQTQSPAEGVVRPILDEESLC